MLDKPAPRRRLQFRLRTLMIVVTLLAVAMGYVGWQAKIARERLAAYTNLVVEGKDGKRLGMVCDVFTDGGFRMVCGTVPSTLLNSVGEPVASSRPSWFRRLLGERDAVVRVICVAADADQDDVAETRWLFPAAEIQRLQ